MNKVSVPGAVPGPLGTEVCPQGCPQAKKCVPANCPRTFQLSPSFRIFVFKHFVPVPVPGKEFTVPVKTTLFKTCPRKKMVVPEKKIVVPKNIT